MTGAAQAYHLDRVGVPVCLFGEPASAGVRILPPESFLSSPRRYGLIMNVDSFTEMPKAVAEDYISAACSRCGTLLSINHEHNAFKVVDLLNALPGKLHQTRDPYWMRAGYVKDVVRFR